MVLWLLSFFSEDAAVELVRRRILRGVYRDYQLALQVTKKTRAEGGMGERCEPFPASAK